MDASLNKDVHECARRHCLLSRATLKIQNKTQDKRTFSLSTPTIASSTYRRIYCPTTGVAPTSKRILEDIEGRVTLAMKVVHAHKGVYVHGLAERTGRRYTRTEAKKKSGGNSVKKDWSKMHLRRTTEMHLLDLHEMRAKERIAMDLLVSAELSDDDSVKSSSSNASGEAT